MELDEKVSNIDNRLSVAEKTIEEHGKLIEKQQEKNDDQIELNAILKMHLDENKKIGETLDKMNENLTHLNTKQETLDKRVTGIENTMNENKEDKKQRQKDKKQLFISGLKYFLSALVGIGLAFLYKKLGL